MTDLGLKNRVVLITGAGRGLGLAYARALAGQGAHVVVHDAGVDKDGLAPDPACAEEAAEALRVAGGSAEVDEALYRRLTGVATDAAFWLASAALPAMRAQGFGRIVNGAIVRARDGTLSLARLATMASRDLGPAADDPVAAGAALTEMSAGAA